MDEEKVIYLYDRSHNILYKTEGVIDYVYKRCIHKWIPYEHGETYDEIEDDTRIFVYHTDADVITEEEAK